MSEVALEAVEEGTTHMKTMSARSDLKAKPRLLRVRGVRTFVRNRLAVIGASALLVITLSAVLAPLIAPYSPIEIHPTESLQPPSAAHWFGTDDLGRDIFSRVLWGGRITLRVGLISALMSALGGLILGLLAGFFGGNLAFMILRLMDLLLAFPGILLALVIVATLGTGINNVMVAVGISAVPTFTRVIYGSALSVKNNDYIDAARAIGAGSNRIIIRHLFPNVVASVIVLFTLQVGAAIFAASSLSFIGLGAQPPSPEWGAMVNRGRYTLGTAMWMSTFPGLAIAIVILSINFVGDGLRDALDPRARTSSTS